MGSRVVDRALQLTGERVSGISSPANVATMSVDDSTVAFAAADTGLGAPANSFDKAFDATPTRSGREILHVATFLENEANFMIRRIALHNDTAANVTGSSATLWAGLDAQSITKDNTFQLEITFGIRYDSI